VTPKHITTEEITAKLRSLTEEMSPDVALYVGAAMGRLFMLQQGIDARDAILREVRDESTPHCPVCGGNMTWAGEGGGHASDCKITTITGPK